MELSDAIKNRRSYRSLGKANINENIIKELSEAAGLDPSCFNNQPWRFIFTYDTGILNKLFESLSTGNAWAKKSSMIITVLSNIDYDCKIEPDRNY